MNTRAGDPIDLVILKNIPFYPEVISAPELARAANMNYNSFATRLVYMSLRYNICEDDNGKLSRLEDGCSEEVS